MILPIIAYGDPVLKRVADDINADYPQLQELIASMFETMYNARGVGLAAPQIGLSVRLFIIDASPFSEDEPTLKGFKKIFINARITEETGKEWLFNEGCLSIPEIREDIERKDKLRITYLDENFKEITEEYSGITARVIQHEYDHIEGKLFIDRLSPLKKRLLEKRLNSIKIGAVKPDYKMKFMSLKRKK